MREFSPYNLPAEQDFSAERRASDSVVLAAKGVFGDLGQRGLTSTFRPPTHWAGPEFEETVAVDLSEEVAEQLKVLGYPDAKQAYVVKTGFYGRGEWRGFGGAYVEGDKTTYELQILTGEELGRENRHSDPDAFLGRGFATLSPECPVRLNPTFNPEAQGNSHEMPVGSESQRVIKQVLSEIHGAQLTEAAPKFVASSLYQRTTKGLDKYM